MGFWGLRSMIFLFFVLSTGQALSQSAACDFVIKKTVYPLYNQTEHEGVCLEDYFLSRDLAFHSFDRLTNTALLSPNAIDINFDDMLLFELPKKSGTPLDERGRLGLVEQILGQFFESLKNNYGACYLRLYEGSQLLSLRDFKKSARDAGGQPGTRLMLTKDDVKDPSWEMVCPSQKGPLQVAKKGKYFFIFADVHENVSLTTTKTHFAQFLFSLN